LIFHRIEPNRDYRSLRFLSEAGRWELGLSPYDYGIRLRMGPSGRPPSVIDFCLGHDTSIYSPVLMAVIHRLKGIDETATPQEIDALFPWAGTRPDPAVHLKELLKVVKNCT
jgi:hypothetical protein